MRILVIGAGGFIGGHIVHALLRDGHEVACAGRNVPALRTKFPGCEALACDLARDTLDDWMARLEEVDAVVNAAGILTGDFAGVQAEGPKRLFEACAALGIRHVIQISGLGASADSPALFLRSKALADERLRDLAGSRRDLSWTVLRPGVVIGPGGQSTALFEALAAFPLPIGIGDGRSRVELVAVEDLAAIACALLLRPASGFSACDVVAPAALTTDALTRTMRRWLGLPDRPMLRVPYAVLDLAAKWGGRLGIGSLTPETLALLRGGLAGDAKPLAAALGWQVGSIEPALSRRPATRADRLAATLFWLRLPLRTGLAAIWIATGLVSAFAYPLADSEQRVATLHLHGRLADASIHVGAALDCVLGLLLLLNIRPKAVGLAQIAVMLGYTALATLADPGLWLQPFGPLLKNIAILLATLTMIAVEETP